MANPTVYLNDYQPAPFAIEKMDLDFELYDDKAIVHNVMLVKRLARGDLRLDGEALLLKSLLVNEQPYPYYIDQNGQLVLKDCPDTFALSIVTEIYPHQNTALSGLYSSNALFCTQCEAEGFRRITYFLDRPDVMTVYTTTIHADKANYPTLLSNGNLIAQGDEDGGRHFATWHDPFKKPSYLFALVAGRLAVVTDQFTTMSGKAVDLRIYVEPGNETKCAHAMTALKASMRWDEQEYGREYDLDVFMIVAVSDFNMGAMENKGLNIFNAKYILADKQTATDQDYADIEGVVAHEYFHNWTGNRVTCRDWFQLSLKEGLTVFRDQEFSSDMNSRDVCRIMDVNVLRIAQFPEDSGAMAHPVQPSSYEEINNFYTATIYNKGAELIRMQRLLLGKEGFRRGMDLYFERHDGQAVTIDDFVAAMSDANQKDLTLFKRWYTQAGTPQVHVTEHYEAGQFTLHFTQSCPKTPEQDEKLPFHIPLACAFFHPDGRRLENMPNLIELTEKETTVFFKVDERPIVSLLRGFSAPIKLIEHKDEASRLFILRHETDGFAKWEALQSVVISQILTFLRTPDAPLSSELVATFRQLLEQHEDEALMALLLAPIQFEQLMGQVESVDVQALEQARVVYRQRLGRALGDVFHPVYMRLAAEEKGELNGKAYGRRALKNTLLWYLMKSNEEQMAPLCWHQFEQALTMTDQIASFNLLQSGADEARRQQSLKQFYAQWQHDDLVLDKWFTAQAISEAEGTLERIKVLLTHPKFSFKNPNKVRALIGAFCASNPKHFHQKNGDGYRFLVEVLRVLDPINPQVAARMATPFTRAARYDAPRRALMMAALESLSLMNGSKDLQEVIDKSLKGLERV